MATYDLDKVLRYGQKIGADVAIIQNGKLRNYYKKGDKASKHCVYTYTNYENGRPLRWESANEFCIERILNFYRNLGHTMEAIQIAGVDISE